MLAAYGIDSSAYSSEAEMFDLVHAMRARVMRSPSFGATRVLGTILFRDTLDRTIEGREAAEYLWQDKGIVAFLEVDLGVAAAGVARITHAEPALVPTGCRSQTEEVWMTEATGPEGDMIVAHFIVSDDVERSRRFYTDVLGGRVVFAGPPTYVALANTWIIINVGGGPTDDKPTVTLETPRDLDRTSSFLNIRVRDIAAVHAEWSARGAEFLTPPKHHQYEIRCYMRDPDGYLIEVGQTTDPVGDFSLWPIAASSG